MERYLGNTEQLCFAREVVGEFGKMIYVKCGKLFLSLNVERALDIYDLDYAGDNLAFKSAVGISGYTAEVDFASRFEAGFLYSCGLENIGGPTATAPTHGTFHFKRCKLTRLEALSNCVIVSGLIDFSSLFGQKLKIRRTYEITQNQIVLTDEFVLSVDKTAQIMQLYHFNIGYPMLSEGTEVSFPSQRIEPRNAHSETGMEHKKTFFAPIDGFEEQCYICSCEEEACRASVENKKLGRKITFCYDGRTLPKFVEWKSERAGDYALGIEPATTHLDNKKYVSVANGDKHIITIQID